MAGLFTRCNSLPSLADMAWTTNPNPYQETIRIFWQHSNNFVIFAVWTELSGIAVIGILELMIWSDMRSPLACSHCRFNIALASFLLSAVPFVYSVLTESSIQCSNHLSYVWSDSMVHLLRFLPLWFYVMIFRVMIIPIIELINQDAVLNAFI